MTYPRPRKLAIILMVCIIVSGCSHSTNQAPAAAAPEKISWPPQPVFTPVAATPPSTPIPLPTRSVPATPQWQKTPVSLPRINDAYQLPLRLPGPAIKTIASDARLAQIKAKLNKWPTSAAYRQLAEQHVRLGNYAEAARAYHAEAGIYRRKGLLNAALVEERKAARYDTTTGLFVDRDLVSKEVDALYSGAPLEPIVGCYIGAFIDRDEQLKQTYFDENWQTHRRPQEFTRHIGKPHASYFMYLRYGQKFPRKWIQNLKAANAIPHIAWEPRSLHSVQNNAYLHNFAKACRAMDWPIFIRFAGEMNGDWTPYHGNPKPYREKFRLVHRVLHKYAPRIATIWCVNSVPVQNIQQYYPGDDGCDWVGVNVYSVPYYDNDRRRPAFRDNVLSLIDPVYNLYARKKPIAICEYAASHMAAVDRVRRNDFAIDQLLMLYGALPRFYPRIKMIGWFSMNNLRYARTGRQLNNYNLTEQPAILENYRRAVSSAYFLGAPERLSNPRPQVPRPIASSQRLHGATRFSSWVKTYVSRPKVYFAIDSEIIYASSRPGVHMVDLDLNGVAPGDRKLTLYVYDDRGRFVTSTTQTIIVEHW